MFYLKNFTFYRKKILQLTNYQKQPPEVLCKKSCSQKFRKIHRKTPVPESLFLTKLQVTERLLLY